ncbi:unnamed protein product [Sphenostylis stenocarpa]|uniref:Uncharacterized protein n=1 Tax=Sphenostylis stenocarpa TaxID=92480 RepID=A0AA86SXQ2_9FABA|nr:unnamed protein product [Sphenostylis stenocarpa]
MEDKVRPWKAPRIAQSKGRVDKRVLFGIKIDSLGDTTLMHSHPWLEMLPCTGIALVSMSQLKSLNPQGVLFRERERGKLSIVELMPPQDIPIAGTKTGVKSPFFIKYSPTPNMMVKNKHRQIPWSKSWIKPVINFPGKCLNRDMMHLDMRVMLSFGYCVLVLWGACENLFSSVVDL